MTTWATAFGVGLMLAGLAGYAAIGGDDAHAPALPNASLTPGAVTPGYQMQCEPPYSPPRVWHSKASTLEKYGYAASMADEFEDDDRVPLCAGGTNGNPLNHWPQKCDRWSLQHRCLAGEAHDKDVLEADVCKAICAGRLTMEQGQSIFFGDWRRFLWSKP